MIRVMQAYRVLLEGRRPSEGSMRTGVGTRETFFHYTLKQKGVASDEKHEPDRWPVLTIGHDQGLACETVERLGGLIEFARGLRALDFVGENDGFGNFAHGFPPLPALALEREI